MKRKRYTDREAATNCPLNATSTLRIRDRAKPIEG